MENCQHFEICTQCTQPHLINELDKPFSFAANYPPRDYFWGKISSKVLYVGVNPFSGNIGENKHFPSEILRQGPGLNSYFRTIRNWYPYLYNGIGKENGVAFTDLVKCSSGTFPIKGMQITELDTVFRNCRAHLHELILQMVQQNLKTIIVSGVHPCWHILDLYFPNENNGDKTIDNICKTTTINGKEINVVFFRKFMGRRDVSHTYREKATGLLDQTLAPSE